MDNCKGLLEEVGLVSICSVKYFTLKYQSLGGIALLPTGLRFNLPVQSNTVVLTYNGVIGQNGFSGIDHRFIISTNGNVPTAGSNPFIRNHVKGNTLFVSNGTFDNVTGTNEFRMLSDGEDWVYIYRLTL